MKKVIWLFPLFLLFFSCGGTQKTGSEQGAELLSEYQKQNTAEDAGQVVNSLEEYLRRIPGLQVSNGGVRIRGLNSSLQSNQPLFVIEGVRIGHSLKQASQLVNVRDIETVKVLKNASETSFYGTAGSNGVIVIKMKKG